MNTSMREGINLQFARKMFYLLYPWCVWALSSLFLFYKYLLQVSPSIMVPDLMQAFALSGAGIGNLAACYFYAYLLMQLPVGILLDAFDPRRVVALAILICAIGAFMFAHAHAMWVAAIGRLLIGIGGAFSAVGTMKLITVWFPANRFALVAGLMMTVGMLGAVGGQAPLAKLVLQHGWRDAILFTAYVGIIFSLVFYVLIRTPEFNLSRVGEGIQEFMQGIRAIFNNRQSWIISLYSGLAFAPISAFAGLWGIPYLIGKMSLSRELMAGFVSLVFIGFAIGAPLSGWLSDTIGKRKPIMFVGTSLTFLILMGILLIPSIAPWVLATLLFLFGFFCSFFFVSFATMRENHQPRFSGTAIGFINMFNALFGALSEPLIGGLLDLSWDGKMEQGVRIFSQVDYQLALSILPIGLIIALGLLYWVDETHCVQQGE